MEVFFFGSADGSTKKALESFAPMKFPILTNYASTYSGGSPKIPKNRGLLFVDSGGFSFFYRLSEYPDSPLKYLNFVSRLKADFFANRDYPNEPQVRQKWGVTVRENQMRTIENQVKIMELMDDYYPKLRPKFVAVLQGWELDDYLYMLDYMKEHGLLTRLIGLGTMCRRGQDEELRRYIAAIRQELPRKYRLHGFGIKFNVLRFKEVWDALYSADSLAFRYGIYNRPEDPRPLWLRVRERLEKWLQKLEYYRRLHEGQRNIFDFVNPKPTYFHTPTRAEVEV